MERNSRMCIQFAYDVKSSVMNKNGTKLTLSTSDDRTQWLWTRSLDDSQGWQTVKIQLRDTVREENFYIIVNQKTLTDASVAFDDIAVQQCEAFPFVSIVTNSSIVPKLRRRNFILKKDSPSSFIS